MPASPTACEECRDINGAGFLEQLAESKCDVHRKALHADLERLRALLKKMRESEVYGYWVRRAQAEATLALQKERQ